MSRMNRRISAWVAVLAMTLNALWPVIAQAKPGPAPTLHEVCTSAGLQKIVVDAGQPADHSGDGKLSPHCAFCSLGSDPVAILPAAPSGIAQVVAIRDALPVLASVPHPAPPFLSTAQPRAPPYPS